MKIQVLFGSQNDERVFEMLNAALATSFEINFEVASAHRDPEKVRNIVEHSGADLFIAGAGLAAHLPGVVASLTQKPVIGVSVRSAFDGLDSFLSIAQMPKGVPVAAIDETQIATLNTYLLNAHKMYINNKNQIHIYVDPILIDQSWANKFMSQLHTLVEQELNSELIILRKRSEAVHAQILTQATAQNSQNLSMYMMNTMDLQRPLAAVQYYELVKSGGMWVGVNNVTNLVLQIKRMRAALCN